MTLNFLQGSEVARYQRNLATPDKGQVKKATASYALVKFQDDSEVWFSQATGKEWKGTARIYHFNQAAFDEAVRVAEASRNRREEKKRLDDHRAEVCRAVQEERFKRFLATPIEILFRTELAGQEAWVFRFRDEIFTLTIGQSIEFSWQRSDELIDQARQQGVFTGDLDDYRIESEVWEVTGTSVGPEKTRSFSSWGKFETKEEALFRALGDSFVEDVRPSELGLSWDLTE